MLPLLSALMSQEALPLGIQIEAKCQLHITKTAIGATLRARLHQTIEETRQREQEMMQELEDASTGWDNPLPDDEVDAIKEDLRTAREEARKLSGVLESITSN